MNENLNHLSLCSGIGGLDLAAEWAGFRTVAQCEIDEYASRVLAKNFKGVPNLHDIRTVTNGRLAELGINPEEITVVSAGFPCQPYSLAGKGLGDRDERDLWGEVARVLGEINPPWFVGENTPGLFARDNQRYFRRILRDLAALGYRVGWGIWGACDVGAPHKRDRVFILAYTHGKRRGVFETDERKPRGALDESETKTPFRTSSVHGNSRGGVLYPGDVHHAHGERRGTDEVAEQCAFESLDQEGRGNESCGTNCSSNVISDAAVERRCASEVQRGNIENSWRAESEERIQESGTQFNRVCGSVSDARSGRYGISEREIQSRRYGAFNVRWWEVEPDVGRVAHGIPARMDKLRCLGNAVVPYQALPIFEAIAEYELSRCSE